MKSLVLWLLVLCPFVNAARLGATSAISQSGDSSDIDRIPSDAVTDRWDESEDNGDNCSRPRYHKRTMKLIREMPFIGLFPDLQEEAKFEASGITFAKGSYWVVFDSLQQVGRVDLHFNFRDSHNMLIGEPGEESQYEGLSYSNLTDTFLLLKESHDHPEHGLVPMTVEVKLAPDERSFEIVQECPVEFVLETENKGFESMYYYDGEDGERYMLGLCESNYCEDPKDGRGREAGEGRLIWAQHAKHTDGSCLWKFLKQIPIPSSAYFTDYSGIAFQGDKGRRVAVVTQEGAKVWIGEFDWENMEFVEEGSKVFFFPRDNQCNVVFCNVEGVVWIDSHRLAFASDKAKKDQPWYCMDKDQSLHVMALPKHS